MKKWAAVVLMLIFIFVLGACSTEKDSGGSAMGGTVSPAPASGTGAAETGLSQPVELDPVCGTVSRVGAEEAFLLTEEETKQILAVLENGKWNAEGTADCANDCQLTIHGEMYYYHSSCGTWNDTLNGRCLTVTDTEKESINAVLSQYIILDLV